MISTLSSRLATLPTKASLTTLFDKASIFTTNPQSQKVPKKPFNTYIQFKVDNYGFIKTKHPGLSAMELSKEVSKMYQSLPESTLNEYKAKYQAEIARYKDQLAQTPPEAIKAQKKAKAEKKLKRVKVKISKTKNEMEIPKCNNLSGYGLFLSEEITKAPIYLSQTEKIKYASEQWNILSDDLKEDYRKLAAEMSAERANEIQAWTEKNMGTEEMKKLEKLMEKKSKLKSKLKEMN